MAGELVHTEQTRNWMEGEVPIRVLESSHMSVERHMHEFYELVYVREGYCLHHLQNSVSLAMEGDLLLIKPGITHQYTGNRECKIYNCLFMKHAFEGTMFDRLMELPGMPQFFTRQGDDFNQMHLGMAERKVIRDVLKQMNQESAELQSGYEIRLQALLYCLMVDCSRFYVAHEGRQAGRDNYSGYVTGALRYIDEHYVRTTLSVQEIAEFVGISGDYLSRQFRKLAGIAVQEYVRRYRLSRAIISLQQGASVGEAAQRNGFHSIGYFSREFKKEMGMTPSAYKEGQSQIE